MKARSLQLKAGATHFGFCLGGRLRLSVAGSCFEITEGMYFSCPGSGQVESLEGGEGFVVSALEYEGFFQLGGPVEEKGRLRYIDGCTDSLLLSPVVKGDPCLNLLHIPSATEQTQHTHPSFRIGVILSGTGQCVTPEGRIALYPGLLFHIPADGLHSFHTEGEALRVLAYHPESDFGPTHENHPMVNKTLIPAS